MAYKFSLGKYVHSGSITAEEGLTVSSGDVALPAGVINNSELQHSGVTVTAGDGLTGGGQMDLGGTVTVNVAGAGALAVDADSVYVSSSIAGDGLLFNETGGKVSLLSVAYGSDAKKAVQGNTAFTASAGNGLSGTASGSIGAGINFTFDVVPAGAMAIKNDKVALSASVAAAGLGLAQDADGAVTELSVQTAGVVAIKADKVALSASVAGPGLFPTLDADGAVTDLYVVGGGAIAIKADKVAISSSIAAQGLGFVENVEGAVTELSVRTAGAVAIKDDSVALSASIAGSGLSAAVDGNGAVTSLAVDLNELSAASIDSGSDAFVYIDSADGLTKKSTITALGQWLASGDGLGDDGNGVLSVQRAGAIAILSDKVALSSSIASTGLTAVTGAQAGAVTTLSVKYGPGAGNAVQGNTAFTASAGNGLTGDFSGQLGSGVDFTFNVASANGGIVVNANDIALTLSSSNALKIDSAGIDLKDTIAGSRTFSNNVTVNGNLYVAGTQTYVDSTNMMLQDPIMYLGSASLGAAIDGDRGIIMSISGATDPVFFWDQSETQFALAKTNTPHDGLEVAVESYADLKVKSLVATQGMQETIQTLSANGAVTASICLVDGASAGFTATLPDASLWSGKMVKVKKSEGTENAIVVAASGSQTLDGVASITLESPYAAVAFVSNGSNWFIF